MSLFRYTAEISEEVRGKIKIFAILTVVCFLGLWMRIWFLQILNGENFQELSESNRIRRVSLPSYRGAIKDRNGETLVTIRPSFNLLPGDTLMVGSSFMARLAEFVRPTVGAGVQFAPTP